MLWDFILYLLYGLTFFTLGVAILSRDTRLSELGIAKILPLLAIFGIVHGFHEWVELLEQVEPAIKTPGFILFRLITIATSFLFLLYFGIFLNIITLYGDQALKTTPKFVKVLVGLGVVALILTTTFIDQGTGKGVITRLFVGFPGGLLSGIGLIKYSQTVRSLSMGAARNFIVAGVCMSCYGILTGIIPSGVMVPVIDVNIVFFRGYSAFFIMFFTIKALSVFNIEQEELINEQLYRFSQSEKLTSMGILAAGIAHEINNPLTNIQLNVDMLKDCIAGDASSTKKIDAIERNVERASRIAKELLHFSREKETALMRVEINRVLASTAHLLRNQENSSIITLDLQDVPEIKGISWKLEEVFINLLLNSLDACTKDDTIKVTSSFSGEKVIVKVIDSGHGISEENLNKVFDPFFTTKDVGKGTGLGLSVCYNILKQHGGEISIMSNEDAGVVVTVSFSVPENESREDNSH